MWGISLGFLWPVFVSWVGSLFLKKLKTRLSYFLPCPSFFLAEQVTKNRGGVILSLQTDRKKQCKQSSEEWEPNGQGFSGDETLDTSGSLTGLPSLTLSSWCFVSSERRSRSPASQFYQVPICCIAAATPPGLAIEVHLQGSGGVFNAFAGAGGRLACVGQVVRTPWSCRNCTMTWLKLHRAAPASS